MIMKPMEKNTIREDDSMHMTQGNKEEYSGLNLEVGIGVER